MQQPNSIFYKFVTKKTCLNNYKLIVQYKGTNYAGWQIQNNAVTVQQKIVEAIEVIIKERVNLIGSGRTDAGVHAFGQVANFRTENVLDVGKFKYSLNAVLPNDIAVNKIEQVEESFHARFDAKSRSYVYLFSNQKSPFFKSVSWDYPLLSKLNFEVLNHLSAALLAEHDFTSLSKKNLEQENKKCTVTEIRWRKGKELSIFYITANRFLHGMVRTIVGTLLYAAQNNLQKDYLVQLLDKRDREEAEMSVPPKGLFLYKVRY
jgi:tRNA pseudouridine38-40 synthase